MEVVLLRGSHDVAEMLIDSFWIFLAIHFPIGVMVLR